MAPQGSDPSGSTPPGPPPAIRTFFFLPAGIQLEFASLPRAGLIRQERNHAESSQVPAEKAAAAGRDIFEPPLGDFLRIFRVCQKAPGHSDEIELSLSQGLLAQLGVEPAGDQNRHGSNILERRGKGQLKAPSVVTPVELLSHEGRGELGCMMRSACRRLRLNTP